MLFRKKMYSFEVDIWAVGCLIAEMVLGEPLFNGESEVEQLFKIFKFTGSPSEELYDKIMDGNKETQANIVLPNWDRVNFKQICMNPNSAEFKKLISAYIPAREQTLQKLMQISKRIGEDGMDLLWNLLELDPQNRISAEAAMNHPFFSEMLQ